MSQHAAVHGDSDGSTDASQSLMGHDEKQSWDSDEGRANRQRTRSSTVLGDVCSVLSQWRWVVDVVLLLFIIGLLLERRSKSYGYCEFESTGDITGFAPKISQQIKTFVPDLSFAPENASEFFSDIVRKKWLALVPKGLGYVKVDNPEKFNNLPTRLTEFTDKTVFTTSVTHQLHCLYAIIETYSTLMTNSSKAYEHQKEGWHMGHCFEYLRQNILCCGDTALEGEATTFPAGQVGSDGWDAKHVCKNYDQIYDYLTVNRANDLSWI